MASRTLCLVLPVRKASCRRKLRFWRATASGRMSSPRASRSLDSGGRDVRPRLQLHRLPVGGIAIDQTGTALPEETLAACQASDAVLLGAVGGPKWSDPRAAVRPEQGLLALRAGLGLFANLRPVKVYPALVDASTLKPEVVDGVDMIIVRELTGGAYFGQPQGQWGEAPDRWAVDSMRYTEGEIARLMRVAFELARARRKKVRRPTRRTCWRRPGLADGGARGPRRVSGRGTGRRAGRCVLDVPGARPAPVRRDRDREHLRRHPVGRGRDAGGQHGHAAVASLGERDCRRRAADGPVRADPRQRAGHRGQGHRQPARDDPELRDAAPLVARPAGRGGRGRAGRGAGPGRGLSAAATS